MGNERTFTHEDMVEAVEKGYWCALDTFGIWGDGKRTIGSQKIEIHRASADFIDCKSGEIIVNTIVTDRLADEESDRREATDEELDRIAQEVDAQVDADEIKELVGISDITIVAEKDVYRCFLLELMSFLEVLNPAMIPVMTRDMMASVRTLLANDRGGHLGEPTPMLTFFELSAKNAKRTVMWHEVEDWTPTDWACAMGGECGEALNQIKKLRRVTGPSDNSIVRLCQNNMEPAHLARKAGKEIGDTVIYADLLCQRLGLSLPAMIIAAFNGKSRQIGSDIMLGDEGDETDT